MSPLVRQFSYLLIIQRKIFLKGKTIIRKNVVILRNLCYTNYIYIKGKNKVKIRYDM